MIGVAALLLALGWPGPTMTAPSPAWQDAALTVPWDAEPPSEIAQDNASERSPWRIFDRSISPPVMHQVRIEQHIVIRVVPHPSRTRSEMAGIEQAAPAGQRFVEHRTDRCLRIADISGMQPQGDNRLLLFMRDHRLLVADLERACSALYFYSGFYIQNNKDGRLCAGRDKLLARTGMRCELSALHVLVPADDRTDER